MIIPESTHVRMIIFFLILLFTGIVQSNAQSNLEIEREKQVSKAISLEGYSASVKLVRYYWNYSLDSSIVYGRRAMLVASGLENDSLFSTSSILLALSYSYKDNLDSSMYYCYLSQNRCRDNRFIEARTLDLLGIMYRRKGNFDSALVCGNRSLLLFKTLHDTMRFAAALGNVSSTYDEMGNYSKALEYSVEAATIFGELNDSINLAKRYGTIANIYLDMGNNTKGIEFLKRAQQLVIKKENPNLYYNIVFNMATVYHDLEKYDSALKMYNSALIHYIVINDREGIAVAHQNIGLTYSEMGNYNLAIKHLMEGYRRFSQLSTVRNIPYVLSDIGLVYSKKNEPDSSIYYLNKALTIAEQYQLIQDEQRIYDKFYQVHKSLHQFKEALTYYEKYRDISDSINNEQVAGKIAELSSKYEADLKDQKIKQLTLNEKISEEKTRTLLIGGGFFVIIVVLMVGILYYRKHTQANLLSVKGKLLEREKTELDKELSYKQKLLTSHALHMTQKNQVLQNIRKAINEVLPDVPETPRQKVRKLQLELNKSLRYDKDWELFSKYFSELNNDFFDKLKALNPALTQYDLRLSALLRMNMNIKEAAAVLNIEPDSVKTARYKLRKKLGLSPDQDLVGFISKL